MTNQETNIMQKQDQRSIYGDFSKEEKTETKYTDA